mgnify:CR=1 FL=1
MKRIVIKLGTGILTTGIGTVDTKRIESICEQIAQARKRGIEVLVVSSGAVGMGMGAMNLTTRPETLAEKQACAAIGQSRLIQCWQDALAPHGILVGQLLLTHEGLKLRNRYINAKKTVDQMLAYGVIPIINENDSISSYEIRFGNNDLLGALVASLTEADQLQILSTAPGLIDMDGTGEIIPIVETITPEIEGLAKGTDSPTAVGGMITKIEAAKLATSAGCDVFIADGEARDIITKILDNDFVGTRFVGDKSPMHSKKRWLAYFQRPNGSIEIDEGACRALAFGQASLLSVGVNTSIGEFHRGDIVDIVSESGEVVARGESQYSSHEIDSIAHKNLAELEIIYPDRNRLEVVHHDALVLL